MYKEITLIDVREPFEWELVHLPGATLIPLRELPGRLAELDPRAEHVVYCHHGARSLTRLSSSAEPALVIAGASPAALMPGPHR